MAPASEFAAADASPLIVLAQGGWLHLLRLAGERIIVPRRVALEIRQSGRTDAAVLALTSTSWLELVDTGTPPPDLQQYHLDPGEAAVLTWALTHPGATAIIDERRGRQVARLIGVPVVGTLGLILEAKRRGLIPAARPVIEHLLEATDWYISPSIIDTALHRADE